MGDLFVKATVRAPKKVRAIETEIIKLNNGFEGIEDYIRRCFMPGNIAVVSDGGVEAAALRIAKRLTRAGYSVREVAVAGCDGALKSVAEVPECVRYFIAVGGLEAAGIVRDEAQCRKCGFSVVAAAPSTDGFIWGGRDKKTPDAVIYDEGLTACAPDNLVAAGYGRIIAQLADIFDNEFKRLTGVAEYYDRDEIQKLALEVHQCERDKEKPDFAVRLMQSLLKISHIRARLNMDSGAADACARAIQSRKTMRVFGEDSMLASYAVLNIYRAFLSQNAFDTLLPPDTHRTVKVLEKRGLVGYNEHMSAYAHMSADGYMKGRFVLAEYRKDLLSLIDDIDLSGLARFWRRLYTDAGFWLHNYISAPEVLFDLALSAELCPDCLLGYIKRTGFLEYFLLHDRFAQL